MESAFLLLLAPWGGGRVCTCTSLQSTVGVRRAREERRVLLAPTCSPLPWSQHAQTETQTKLKAKSKKAQQRKSSRYLCLSGKAVNFAAAPPRAHTARPRLLYTLHILICDCGSSLLASSPTATQLYSKPQPRCPLASRQIVCRCRCRYIFCYRDRRVVMMRCVC